MKRREIVFILCILLFLIISLSSFAVADTTPYSYESLVLMQNITTGLHIIPNKTTYDVSYVDIRLNLVPVTSFRQEVLSQSFSPKPEEIKKDSILFHWPNPQETNLLLESSFRVKTSDDIVRITKKIPFPATNISLDLQKYLKETESIDSNEKIKHTAFMLANNVDDLFELEFNFAEWVNKEITYNLSSLTSEANEPSSWVYDNRYGVCDEITNLFISFNRAVGIPARFVSGIAYSDAVKNKWGNHGWAEVYFPTIGWVPFDVTYEEYGFVDATHIALTKGIDGTSSSVRYASRGHDYDFNPLALNFSTEIIAKGRVSGERTQTTLGVQKSTVGFGSYNLVIADIRNARASYVVEKVTLAKTEGLTFFDPLQKIIFLAPNEEKKLYWLVRVNDTLSKNYVYTFPISAILSKGTELTSSFRVEKNQEEYSKLYMQQFLVDNKEGKEIDIDCQAKDVALVNEKINVQCTFVKDKFPITLCLNTVCKEIKSKDDIASLPLESTHVGVHTVIVHSADNKYQTFVTYKVSDIAKLGIDKTNISQNISFDEQARLKVYVKKISLANPINVTITVSDGLTSESWNFSEFDEDKEFDLLIDGKTLATGRNTFIISVDYTDNLGKEHNIKQPVQISMIAKTGSQKLQGAINRFSIEINRMSQSISKGLFGRQYEQFQHFTVLLLTFIVLVIISSIIKSFVHMIKRKLLKKLD